MKLPSTLFLAACTIWGSSTFVAQAHAQSSSSSALQVTTSRGRLGAQVITISESLRRHFAAPADAGLLVDRVLPNSPAAKAGLVTGDVIVSVNGSSTAEVWDIFKALSRSKTGDKVNVKVIRNKKPKTLQATLDDDATGNSMRWGNGANPFGAPGDALGGWGQGEWDPSSLFREGKNFPFGRMHQGPMQKGAEDELREKVRKLEERLNTLEGRKAAPKTPAATKKSPKPRAAWGTGRRT
jgi:hypothetical protein